MLGWRGRQGQGIGLVDAFRRIPVYRRRQACGWAVAIAGAVLTCLIFYPGQMTHDAENQLQQAQTGHFNDWHPPMMAWLWSLINRFIPGPLGLFILLLVLYWGGFGLIWVYFSRQTRVRFLAVLPLPYLPFLVNFAGMIFDDVLVLGCYLTSLGLILLRPRRRPLKIAAGAVIFLLLLVGALARYNTVLAIIPMVVLWIWPQPATVRPLPALFGRIALSAVATALIWLVSWNIFNQHIVHAEKAQIQNSLFAWELVEISHLIHKNLLPGNWSTAQTRAILDNCSDPSAENRIIFYECSFVSDELHRSGVWTRGLFVPFIQAAMAHPLQYAETRLRYLHAMAWPDMFFAFPRDGSERNFAFGLVKRAYQWMKTAPVVHYIFTLLFWLLSSLIVATVSLFLWLRRGAEFYQVFLLSLSAVLYIWPLVIIGIAIDFRYGCWTVAATCLSLLMWPSKRGSPAVKG